MCFYFSLSLLVINKSEVVCSDPSTVLPSSPGAHVIDLMNATILDSSLGNVTSVSAIAD